MALYGKAAEIASRLLSGGHEIEPRSAWNRAVTEVFPHGSSSREKGCPRDAFLALCSLGVVTSVPAGTYTRSKMNRDYIERALAAVRESPELMRDQERLWQIATANAGIRPNYQLEVLSALWSAGLVQSSI
jgi:hypothetical protein